MALIEYTLFGKLNKVNQAIDRLQGLEQEGDPYWLAFSGGKDSVVIKRLAEMAGVRFEAHYSVTGVDPPELVRFIKSMSDVYFDIPHDSDGKPITMWNLIEKKLLPPTRVMRYCCDKLKESSGIGRLTITGVRWAESTNRQNNKALINIQNSNKAKRIMLHNDNTESRRMVERCYQASKTLINPIIDWTDDEVWEFIRTEKIPYCQLYDDGKTRLGCIGCPMSGHAREKDFIKYPKYLIAYHSAFKRMIQERERKGKKTFWKNSEQVMDWWLDDRVDKIADGQIAMELEELENEY